MQRLSLGLRRGGPKERAHRDEVSGQVTSLGPPSDGGTQTRGGRETLAVPHSDTGWSARTRLPATSPLRGRLFPSTVSHVCATALRTSTRFVARSPGRSVSGVPGLEESQGDTRGVNTDDRTIRRWLTDRPSEDAMPSRQCTSSPIRRTQSCGPWCVVKSVTLAFHRAILRHLPPDCAFL